MLSFSSPGLKVFQSDSAFNEDEEQSQISPELQQDTLLTLLPPKEIPVKYTTLVAGILKGAIPCMIQFFSALFVNNTTLHYIGLKNDIIQFNGISLALSILNCFSFYIIFHTNIGFNAAASQALGAQKTKLVGLYLHRALVLHFMISIFSYAIICAAPFLFRQIGVRPDITIVAFNFLVMSPGYIIGIIIFDTLKNYLYAHKSFNPSVIAQLIIAVAYWFLNDLLFIKWDMQLKGLILSLTISQLIGVIVLLLYLVVHKPVKIQDTWFCFRRESFKDLWPLAKIMIGVGGMGYIEVFSYRILSFASTYFSSEQMAAFTSFLALGDLYYVLPVGISLPLTVFIGNAMGARDKSKIFKTIKLTFAMSTVLLIALLIVFGFFKYEIFSFYTKDEGVKAIMGDIGILYFITFPADFYQNLLAGVIKGLGKEEKGAKAFVLSLYLVGLPTALILGFVMKLQAFGMWLGNGIGIYCVLILFFVIVIRTDFDTQFDYIITRIKDSTPLL